MSNFPFSGPIFRPAHKDADRFYVLTGGPGSGKTTLIDVLHQAGYAGTVEAGRAIIQDQMAMHGRGLPWIDPVLFAELMLSWDIRSYDMARQHSGPVFFDRGIVDIMGYLRLLDLPVPNHVTVAVDIFRYNRRVFIMPPWKEIYEQDSERKQDFQTAVRTHEAMVAAYTASGYELIEVPRAPVDRRTQFLLSAAGVQSAQSLGPR